MASIYFFFLLVALASNSHSATINRIRRDISPAVIYGPPAVDHDTQLQASTYNLLNQIHSELNQIESLIRNLISQYSRIHVNTVSIKSSNPLPREYGPPEMETSLYNARFIKDNTETIQSSINNLKSIAQHLENELDKHAKHPKKHPHSRLETSKVPVIDPNQHYHINAPGVLPEFLTLDPFVAYGPAPNVNFAPPAPGATSGITTAETDIYSPPDGVLLAPPAPGKFPIRTRNLRR